MASPLKRMVTVARPLSLGSFGLPFNSSLLITFDRPLLLDICGLPFDSPLLIDVVRHLFFVPLADPFYWVQCPPLRFASFDYRCRGPVLEYLWALL